MRVKPITILTPRVKPTTEYSTPRDRSNVPLTCDNVNITCDSTFITCDMISQDLWPITTLYNTPRKDKYLEDLRWINVLDLSWKQVLSISGNKVNKIDTLWL